jgi:urease accessory protein
MVPALALATEPAAPRLQRARGVARIEASLRDGQTEIATLYQEGCAKVRLPHTHDSSLQAVLMNTAGGLCGGDHIQWQADANPGTRVVVTTPACERVYRSLGGEARIENRIGVAQGAHVDWLPQETILYEGGRLSRSLDVDLADGATFTAAEAVLIGRTAMGEIAPSASFTDRWRVRRNGRLLHAESTRLGGTALERDGLSLLDGALAFATILHIAPDAERHLEAVRAHLCDTAGASLIGERLVVRVLAPNGLALRRSIAPIIALLSRAGALPRLWHL